MTGNEELVVCVGEGGDEEEARILSERLGVRLSLSQGENLTVRVDGDGIALVGFGLTFRGDFEQMLRRVGHGHLQHEMLAHAAKTKADRPSAIDATAGMGEDSLILAACGYEVTMYEKNAVIAALLRDAMKRAEKNPELCEIVGRMHLEESDSINGLSELKEKPELIYLDPMFPKRRKSGLINKKLQLMQKLEQPCCNEIELLETAIEVRPKKIVIKRPLKGTYLAGKEPDYSIEGKAIRYDCFMFP